MKKFLILTSVIMFLAGVYFFNSTEAEENFVSTEEQNLKTLYREMWKALLSKDIATLNKIHSDDFILTHITGLNQPKSAYLRCVRDGELNYFSEETENIFVEVNGNTAKLIGQSKVNAAVFGGSRHIWRLQLAFDVKKISGKWILTHAKASTY